MERWNQKEIELIEKYMGYIDEDDFGCDDIYKILIEEMELDFEEIEAEELNEGVGGGLLRQAGVSTCKFIPGKIKRYGCLSKTYGKYIGLLKKEISKASDKEKSSLQATLKKAEKRLANYDDVVKFKKEKNDASDSGDKEGKKKAHKKMKASKKKAKDGQGAVRRTFLSARV